MFEDSLLESGGRLASRQPWTTAISFLLQAAIGTTVVLMSLLYTESLPIHTLADTLEAPPPPAAPAAPAEHVTTVARQSSEIDNGVLIPPREIPRTIAVIHDQPNELGSNSQTTPGVPYGVPGTSSNSMLTELLRTPSVAPRVAPPMKVRVSAGVAQGLLIREVKPQYPSLARQARIQGTVVLQAVIGKDGTVQELRVISGHPLLVTAAIDAVRQWRYRPYYLNGEPVTVDTQINVIFTLTGE